MKLKYIALIGYSGLIGSNFASQIKQKNLKVDFFNSKNISKINTKKKYDLVFCAALPAAKWYANKYPKIDFKNTTSLIKKLNNINTKLFILISTIDVWFKHPYGRNRLRLERYVCKKFNKKFIIRLPGVFGRGLKKNVIFDLIKKNNLDNFFINDEFQWYDLSYLSKDVFKIVNKNKSGLFELYSEPVSNLQILKYFKKIKIFQNRDKPILYNFIPKDGYYISKRKILTRIKKFIFSNEH